MTEYPYGSVAGMVVSGSQNTAFIHCGYQAWLCYQLHSACTVFLEYHLHYMVLALANFLGGFATNAIIPVTVNYVIECFKGHASESAAIMGLYRLAFSLTMPFFIPAWIDKLGFGWCLGMAAFFSILAYEGIIL